jgi:DNA-binding NtrC family response regulator
MPDASILIYGKDPVLLQTRQIILQREGFQCVAVDDVGDVMTALHQQDVALLIVCSSLEEGERDAVLSAVDKAAKPGLRKLILTKESKVVPDADFVTMLQTPAAPHAFVALVRSEIS